MADRREGGGSAGGAPSGEPVIGADEYLLGQSRLVRALVTGALVTGGATARTRAQWDELVAEQQSRPIAPG